MHTRSLLKPRTITGILDNQQNRLGRQLSAPENQKFSGVVFQPENRVVVSLAAAILPLAVEICQTRKKAASVFQSRMSWRNHSVGISRPRPARLASS
jgi:hypothetical protein